MRRELRVHLSMWKNIATALLLLLAAINAPWLTTSLAQVGLPFPGPGTVHSAGGGGIAVVCHAHGSAADNPTTNTVDCTGATLLVVNAATLNGISGGVPTDSQSNAYGSTGASCNSPFSQACLYFLYSPSVSSSMTFTLPGTSLFGAIEVIGFSGTSGTVEESVAEGTAATATTCQTASALTPSTNNQVIVSGFYATNDGGGATYSIDSGMTITDFDPFVTGTSEGGGVAYKVQTTATAIQPTWTDTGTFGAAVCSLASFK